MLDTERDTGTSTTNLLKFHQCLIMPQLGIGSKHVCCKTAIALKRHQVLMHQLLKAQWVFLQQHPSIKAHQTLCVPL